MAASVKASLGRRKNRRVRAHVSKQLTGTIYPLLYFLNSPSCTRSELGVRGSVQLVSHERGGDEGATSEYCRRPGRLSGSRGAPHDGGNDGGGGGGGDGATLVLAFGDAKLCKDLVASASRAGVALELLPYEPAKGHRQMVEKLLVKFRALPPHTLVVKLDGSDVVLGRDAGVAGAFRDRWAALGGGVVFTAEAALFFHIGGNGDDCRAVTSMPPSPTVYRFLNSGGYLGTAGDLALVLAAALALTEGAWTSKDDQSVYAAWFAYAHAHVRAHAAAAAGRGGGEGGRGAGGGSGAGGGGGASSSGSDEFSGSSSALAAPPITLDYCQDIFAALSGPKATAHFSLLRVQRDGSFRHGLTGSHPLVAHLPGRGKRFTDFAASLPRPTGPPKPSAAAAATAAGRVRGVSGALPGTAGAVAQSPPKSASAGAAPYNSGAVGRGRRRWGSA